MSTFSETPPEQVVPATIPPSRLVYWSVLRELWENRSIYVAPLAVAPIALFGFMLSTIGMPARRRALLSLDLAEQRARIAVPYDAVAMLFIVTAFLVGAFYCLDALHAERRDRSILFWKSLPVSDLTTVLSKVSIPMVILPAILFPIVVITQFVMMLMTTAVLLPSGLAGTTWTRFNLLEQSAILLYGLVTMVLWHAPVYGWLLMVSAWARRATLLWAVLPFIAVSIFERIAFGTSYFAMMLNHRITGFMTTGFAFKPKGTLDRLSQLTPWRFMTTPGLWIGLVFAAIFIVVTVRLRRDREPI